MNNVYYIMKKYNPVESLMFDNEVKTREELIERLSPFASGCFSGNVADWPQLKPLLHDIYNYLVQEESKESKQRN